MFRAIRVEKNDFGYKLEFWTNPGITEGEKVYLLQEEINGRVILSWISTKHPRTNRGIEKETGWLGSWTEPSGCTKDYYSRGLFNAQVEERTERYVPDNDYEEEETRKRWVVTLTPVP